MPFCGEASNWSKLCLTLLLPGCALHFAGLGTPYWMKTATVSNNVHHVVGLWSQVSCSGAHGTPCVGQPLDDVYETDLMKATRWLEVSVVVPVTFALILSIYYILSPAVRTQKASAWIMMSCFCAVLISVTGTATWIRNIPDNYYAMWSMGLTLIAAAIFLLCGILMIPDIRMYDYLGIQRRKIKQRKKKEKKEKARNTTKATY